MMTRTWPRWDLSRMLSQNLQTLCEQLWPERIKRLSTAQTETNIGVSC